MTDNKILNIELIGDCGVGKSCLLLKYIDDTYTESYISTIGYDFKSKIINLDNDKINVKVWDTMGWSRYREIPRIRNSSNNISVVVYDTTDSNSFENVKGWINDINIYRNNPHICIVATKVDLETRRIISYEGGKSLADSLNCEYYETSAKTGYNIEFTFFSIIKNYYGPKIEVFPDLQLENPKLNRNFWSFNIRNWF